MKVIHKFKLNSDQTKTELTLKKGFKIVHSEYVLVEKSIFIWVEQTLDVTTPSEKACFHLVQSGDPLPDHLQHVASVVNSFAPESYHIFMEPKGYKDTHQVDFSKLTFRAA